MAEHRRIIAVDDAEDFVSLVKQLIKAGHKDDEVEAFSNPLKALDFVKEHDVDVVVSDCDMPGLDGFALSNKILEVRPQVKIIIMSGWDIPYLQKRAEKAGLDGKVTIIEKGHAFELNEFIDEILKG